jgi:cytochrome P450
MHWFLLAMIAYPEKQKKCQEELDNVVGRSRVPTFKDWDNLPYLRATVREVLRWRSALPFGAFALLLKRLSEWLINRTPGIPHYTKEVR